MPYDTSDGLKEVKWQDHYAYFLGLFKASPIFETRNIDYNAMAYDMEVGGDIFTIELAHGNVDVRFLAIKT